MSHLKRAATVLGFAALATAAGAQTAAPSSVPSPASNATGGSSGQNSINQIEYNRTTRVAPPTIFAPSVTLTEPSSSGPLTIRQAPAPTQATVVNNNTVVNNAPPQPTVFANKFGDTVDIQITRGPLAGHAFTFSTDTNRLLVETNMATGLKITGDHILSTTKPHQGERSGIDFSTTTAFSSACRFSKLLTNDYLGNSQHKVTCTSKFGEASILISAGLATYAYEGDPQISSNPVTNIVEVVRPARVVDALIREIK